MSEPLPLTEGCWARVRLLLDCDGAGKPHHPAEDGMRVKVTTLGEGDHRIRGNYKGGPWSTVPKPPVGLGVGRYFSADELEVLTAETTDPTPEDDERRRAQARAAMLGG